LNRGFDVRGWIDGELQRLGVKKSEIGWMSDANTHAKKEQLQKDVRSGKVRILIGSPKNMGTGLNVQDRLKVLHFLAPPWFPADVTQPHGRIERQGNQNSEIEMYWYATEGTYDSTGWGMVARKQKFIDDAMSGSESVRTLEDISEINMFEMAAALAAGDDRVIRIAELGGEVERLTRLKGAHADTQRSLRSDISTLQDYELPRLEKRQAELKQAQAAKGGYEPFSLTVEGKSFDKHGEAGEALKGAALDVADAKALKRTELGKLYGKFPVSIDATRHGDFQISVNVGGTDFEAGRPFERVEELDNVGIIRSLEAAVQRISSELQEGARHIAKATDMLDKAKAKYGAPYPDEQALSEAIAERNRLQNEMAEETKAKEQPQVAASAFVGEPGEAPDLTPEELDKVWVEAADYLRKIHPHGHGLNLEIANRLYVDGRRVEGFYEHARRLIAVAANPAQGRPWVLAHESVHALRRLGVFTEGEWKLLVRDAWTNDSKMRDDVRKRWGDLSEEALQEEAVAERFGEYFDLTETHGWKGRLARRVLNLIAGLARAVHKLTGNAAGVEAIDALRIHELMRKGEIGARPEGFGETPVDEGVAASIAEQPQAAGPEFDPRIEERWQKANGTQVSGAGFLDRSKGAFQHFVEGWSRHYEHLPNTARFADFKEQARKLEAAPEAAYEKVVRHLTALVGKLSPREYDVMKRKVVLDDLAWEADREHELPFGFNPETLKAARQKINAMVATMPKVIEAVRQRKLANYELSKELVSSGVLRSDQIRNPAYYRHMVLDYARAQIEAAQNGGTIMVAGRPVKVQTPYWAKRKGSQMDINSNLLEAEADWMLKAHTDIQTAKTLQWLKESEHNIRDTLAKRAKAENDQLYAEALKHNPSARKEDGRLKSMMARGFDIVRGALEYDLDVPDEMQEAADAIANGSRSENTLALLSWIMDEKKPGRDGAALILAGIGGRKRLMRDLLAEKWLDTQDIKGLVKHYAPEGYSAWQPLEGQHLFTAKTVSESRPRYVREQAQRRGIPRRRQDRARTRARAGAPAARRRPGSLHDGDPDRDRLDPERLRRHQQPQYVPRRGRWASGEVEAVYPHQPAPLVPLQFQQYDGRPRRAARGQGVGAVQGPAGVLASCGRCTRARSRQPPTPRRWTAACSRPG
jgi:hypothetical protein